MTTPDQQPNPQQPNPQQPNPRTIPADDLLAQRPAAIAEPVRAATPPTGRPSVTAILAAVVVAAVMFAGGLLVGHATSASAAAQGTAGGFAGNGRAFGGGAGRTGGTAGQGGFTAGKITSIDGSTLTITTSDGKTVKVTTTSSTTVSKTTQSDVASLATGDTVTVIGPAAADGSVAAQRISEGTAGFGGQGGARPGATPAPTR
jgi:hypothetical protein